MKIDKKELLAECRYYKGEDVPPKNFTSRQCILWQTEREWVERELEDWENEFLSKESSRLIDEFRAGGMYNFEEGDGISMSLKAALYSLIVGHWNEGVCSKEAFSHAYADWKEARL